MKTLSYGVFRMTSSVRPAESLPDASRIQSLDILRGMALLGMIVVHLHDRRPIRAASMNGFACPSGGWSNPSRMGRSRSSSVPASPFSSDARKRRAGPSLPSIFGDSWFSHCSAFAAHAFFGYNVLLGYAVWAVPLLLILLWLTRALLLAAVLSAASVSLYRLTAAEYPAADCGT